MQRAKLGAGNSTALASPIAPTTIGSTSTTTRTTPISTTASVSTAACPHVATCKPYRRAGCMPHRNRT